MSSVKRANNPCTNPICGSTYFTKSHDGVTPVWLCSNCCHTQPRQTRNRRRLWQIAFDNYIQLQEEWEPVEQQLRELIRQGKAKDGSLYVHGTYDNFHMRRLSCGERGSLKLTRWEVQYHTKQARQDLEQAKQFVQQHSR